MESLSLYTQSTGMPTVQNLTEHLQYENFTGGERIRNNVYNSPGEGLKETRFEKHGLT